MPKKKYFTEEERKQAQREASRRYRQKNKEKIAAYNAEYRKNNKEYYTQYNAEWLQNNKEERAAYRAEYYSTQFGRANSLLNGYRRSDKERNRGECTLTEDWIIEHIFSKPCNYCGETEWTKIGCDRKDSSIPHTPDNCVPCCKHCNDKKGATPYDEYMKKIGKIA